jgi:hypothetical protein
MGLHRKQHLTLLLTHWGLISGSNDTVVTGGTYSNGTTLFRNNTGGTFNVSGFSTGNTFHKALLIDYHFSLVVIH